jgi:hypothetical protein
VEAHLVRWEQVRANVVNPPIPDDRRLDRRPDAVEIERRASGVVLGTNVSTTRPTML